MTLSTVTVTAVCLLVYLSISRALRPAKTIVTGLVEIKAVNPTYRLPTFALNEWRRIASAINQLTDSQQQLLTERQKLVVKLINLQEDVRRFMVRELHDEFGQCLAAINAVATSIQYSAAQQCPELVDEAKQISRITDHMLSGVRHMLGRLRPVEFDEFGLAPSLNNLVSNWNTLSSGKTHYQLSIRGDCASLPEPLAVTLFRIVQECLTNIAKHAASTIVSINITINNQGVNLKIKDDGIATQLPFTNTDGIGLLGIRERITAMNGQLRLSIAEPHGLSVEAWLPVDKNAEGKT
jgi:glucose-6-phosphate-specific signal transduction histidine kinase